jgi:hypothetical protein
MEDADAVANGENVHDLRTHGFFAPQGRFQPRYVRLVLVPVILLGIDYLFETGWIVDRIG